MVQQTTERAPAHAPAPAPAPAHAPAHTLHLHMHNTQAITRDISQLKGKRQNVAKKH